MQRDDRTRVTILTASYKIHGEIALTAGARLTDYIVDAKNFIAVAEAEVLTHSGREVVRAPFLNVNRDLIEVLIPG